MAVAFAAGVRNVVDSKLAVIDVVARLSRHAATATAAMVKELLDLVVGVAGGPRSTLLVEGAKASLRAVRAGNLLWNNLLDEVMNRYRRIHEAEAFALWR